MYILTVRYAETNVTNKYSADQFKCIGRELVYYQGERVEHVRLGSHDRVYIADNQGNTVDVYQAPDNPDKLED